MMSSPHPRLSHLLRCEQLKVVIDVLERLWHVGAIGRACLDEAVVQRLQARLGRQFREQVQLHQAREASACARQCARRWSRTMSRSDGYFGEDGSLKKKTFDNGLVLLVPEQPQ